MRGIPHGAGSNRSSDAQEPIENAGKKVSLGVVAGYNHMMLEGGKFPETCQYAGDFLFPRYIKRVPGVLTSVPTGQGQSFAQFHFEKKSPGSLPFRGSSDTR